MANYWKDIDISFDKKNDGDIKDDIDLEAVKNSIENIFRTMQGSRRMLPTFAKNLYNYLFDQVDKTTSYKIANELLEAINIWDNRVIVENVKISPDPDNNQYYVRLTFSIENYGETATIDEIIYAL